MNRQIKFRYWNGIISQMVYDPSIRSDYQLGLNQYINEDRGWVWMQFTGLLDNNGKEIYEGDILKVEGYLPRGDGHWDDVLAVVAWENSMACFYAEDDFLLSLHEYDPEIIGNRFENPDLLPSTK